MFGKIIVDLVGMLNLLFFIWILLEYTPLGQKTGFLLKIRLGLGSFFSPILQWIKKTILGPYMNKIGFDASPLVFLLILWILQRIAYSFIQYK